MKCFHSEFKRSGNQIEAKLLLEKKKGDDSRQVNFQLEFWHLPYIIRDLRKAWAEERQVRQGEINDINQALGEP